MKQESLSSRTRADSDEVTTYIGARQGCKDSRQTFPESV